MTLRTICKFSLVLLPQTKHVSKIKDGEFYTIYFKDYILGWCWLHTEAMFCAAKTRGQGLTRISVLSQLPSSRFVFCGDEFFVKSALCHEFLMGAALFDGAAVEYQNPFGIANDFQAARNHNDGFVFHQSFDSKGVFIFGFGFDICRCFSKKSFSILFCFSAAERVRSIKNE